MVITVERISRLLPNNKNPKMITFATSWGNNDRIILKARIIEWTIILLRFLDEKHPCERGIREKNTERDDGQDYSGQIESLIIPDQHQLLAVGTQRHHLTNANRISPDLLHHFWVASLTQKHVLRFTHCWRVIGRSEISGKILIANLNVYFGPATRCF